MYSIGCYGHLTSSYVFLRLLTSSYVIFILRLLLAEPSKTNFQVVSTYEDGFNLTWSTQDQYNAASLFYVKYKKTDWAAAPWLRTALTTDNYIHLTELDRGTKYSVILVATTGTEHMSLETDSDVIILKTAGHGKLFNTPPLKRRPSRRRRGGEEARTTPRFLHDQLIRSMKEAN